MTGLLALVIGIVAGLRAMTAPAAVSWAARLGWLDLSGTGLALLGRGYTPWILTVLALGELVTDQLPTTPSRTVPMLATGFGSDRPAAFIEDGVAIVAALLAMAALR